jgi:CheY-like chemotaxis protein
MSTILVVDDRPDARYALVRCSSADFDVRETATGRDALRLARSAPDLIVLDIALQDMDVSRCRRKADGVTSRIPVVHKTAVFRRRAPAA